MLSDLNTKHNVKKLGAHFFYFNNPVGIGEHPQHIEEMDKLMANMVGNRISWTCLLKNLVILIVNNFLIIFK